MALAEVERPRVRGRGKLRRGKGGELKTDRPNSKIKTTKTPVKDG